MLWRTAEQPGGRAAMLWQTAEQPSGGATTLALLWWTAEQPGGGLAVLWWTAAWSSAAERGIFLAPGAVFFPQRQGQQQPLQAMRVNVAYANDPRFLRFLQGALKAAS